MSSDFYAYGPDKAGLETVMRFHAVKRWHMIDTTRQQTLAEHSANVALLAFYIAKTAPRMAFGGALAIAALALLHDVGEVFIGDVPSHVKAASLKLKTAVNDLEHDSLPEPFREQCPTDIKLLIKLCDLADGIRFIRLHGVDTTSRHARQGLEEQLEARKEQAYNTYSDDVADYVMEAVHFYAYELS